MTTNRGYRNETWEPEEWFANEVVENPHGVHVIRAFTEQHDTGAGEKETDRLIELTFTNSVGPTCTIDDKLERMNMAEWRIVCDKTLEFLFKKHGVDPDDYDWPTPKPHVTHVADEDDITETVTVVFSVDELTFGAVKRCLDMMEAARKKYEGVEWCPVCDTEFSYEMDRSKLVAVCPKCGALVALCNECDRRKDCAPGTCEALKVIQKVIPAKRCK